MGREQREKTKTAQRETVLYAPVKAFLQAAGYEVKAEVAAADVVAVMADVEPVIVELKLGFSLQLFHQAIARLAITDCVYIAVPRGAGRRFQRSLSDNIKLARRLGLGLLTVRLTTGLVEVHCEPGPYAPRRSSTKRRALLQEFNGRRGDPNVGGAHGPRVTAYRQDAMACAAHLLSQGPTKGAHVKAATGIDRATRIMSDNHYGWFERVELGIYGLTERGRASVGQVPC
ncbi:MAG: DUF2161 domain-containing phosphodiesterase [Pseudomonadota bacterium]